MITDYFSPHVRGSEQQKSVTVIMNLYAIALWLAPNRKVSYSSQPSRRPVFNASCKSAARPGMGPRRGLARDTGCLIRQRGTGTSTGTGATAILNQAKNHQYFRAHFLLAVRRLS